MEKLRTCIVGCTGVVGQQFVRMLDSHPWFEVVLLAASSRSAGKTYAEAARWSLGAEIPGYAAAMPVVEASAAAVLESGAAIAFSALPAAVAAGLETELANGGCHVFTNASAHRMDPDVPVVVPEVNPEHFGLIRRAAPARGAIVADSNCSTAGLVLTLKPLLPFAPRRVVVSTYQAVSGAGRAGLPALDILGNAIPFIRGEEEKLARESNRILGCLAGPVVRDAGIEVCASCCRVAAREGHLMSVTADLDCDPAPDEIAGAFRDFRGVPQAMALPTAPQRPLIVRTEEDRPQPLLDAHAGFPPRARGMAVTIGRIRRHGRSVSFFLLVHNTIRGAAGTCILNAEYALRAGLIRQVAGRPPEGKEGGDP